MDYTVRGILQARILEWVAVPFSRGSSQPRDRTQVSHIAGGFFTSWATREALGNNKNMGNNKYNSLHNGNNRKTSTVGAFLRWDKNLTPGSIYSGSHAHFRDQKTKS